jgi:hypothetical protein
MTIDYRALCDELKDAYAWCLEECMRVPAEEDTLIQRARAALAQPEPEVPVSERLPKVIEQVLIEAECALSDIAEGEAEENEGDPLQWAEKRAADALARIRPVMHGREIRTSEWPPLPVNAIPSSNFTKA